jgi:hypothetical protein
MAYMEGSLACRDLKKKVTASFFTLNLILMFFKTSFYNGGLGIWVGVGVD